MLGLISGTTPQETKEWTLKKVRQYTCETYSTDGLSDATLLHYDGEALEGKPHGTGIALYNDGSRYGGRWSHGLKEGSGVMDSKDDGSYDGEWQRNVYCGQGKRVYADTSLYIGEWNLGTRHGIGTLQTKDYKYEGPWVSDKPHGPHAKFHSTSSIRIVPTPSSASSNDPTFPIEFFLEKVGSGLKSYDGFLNSEQGRQGRGKTEYRNAMVYSGDYHMNVRQGKGKCSYENRDKYEGDWHKDQRHGSGTLHYAAGGRYEGEWKNDQKHGRGSQDFPNGDKYVGGWNKGLISGNGVMTYKNGDVYDGYWQNNRRHGMGNLKFFKQKAEYTGPMANGVIHTGEGEETGSMLHSNGDLFIGTFIKGVRTKGIMWCTNGNTYSGSWQHDKFHGKGVMWDKDGGFYYGNWSKGAQNGQGCKKYADGSEYVGDWVDGERSGSGLLQRDNSSIVHGAWAADAPAVPYYDGDWAKKMYHGRGTYHYANASLYSGIWVEGIKAVTGQISFKDGAKYFGSLSHDLPHGNGLIEYPNGSVYSGGWSYGTRQGHGILFDTANKITFNGVWLNDERVGPGVLYAKDTVMEATWDANGKLHGPALVYFMKGSSVLRSVRCNFTEGVERTELLPRLVDPHGLNFAASHEGNVPSNASILTCTGCNGTFTMTRWKYTCPGCHKPHCSTCMKETRIPVGFSRFDTDLVPSSEKQMENKSCVSCSEKAQQGATVVTAWEAGTVVLGTVQAQCFTGNVVKHYPNDDVYIGAMVRDVEEGHGNSIRASDGEEYFGQWKDGVRSGRGFLLHTDCTVKEGVFESNVLFTLRYHGEVVKEMTHGITTTVLRGGRGVAFYENGDEYNGQHSNDMRHGIGYMQYANNDAYIGEWRNGKKNGRGRLTGAEGDVYTGFWKDDLRHGKGTLKQIVKTKGEAETEVIEGEWKDDKLEGVVLVRSQSGETSAQMWVAGAEKRDVFSLPPSLPDSASSVCQNKSCGRSFTFLRRRHHCRGCGKLFCGDCSAKTHEFPKHFDYSSTASRSCDECKTVYTTGRAARLVFSADKKVVTALLLPGLKAVKDSGSDSFAITHDGQGASFAETTTERTKDMTEETFCEMFNKLNSAAGSLLTFPSEVLSQAAATQWDAEAIIGDIVTEHVPFVSGTSTGEGEYKRPMVQEKPKAPEAPPPEPSFQAFPSEETLDEIILKEGKRMDAEDKCRVPLTLEAIPAPEKEQYTALEWSAFTPDKDIVNETKHKLAAGATQICSESQRKELPLDTTQSVAKKKEEGGLMQVMSKPINIASSAVNTVVSAPGNAISSITNRGAGQVLSLTEGVFSKWVNFKIMRFANFGVFHDMFFFL